MAYARRSRACGCAPNSSTRRSSSATGGTVTLKNRQGGGLARTVVFAAV
ncbi:hypothetical protein NKJ59_19425 [Mesorhizobium australicum]